MRETREAWPSSIESGSGLRYREGDQLPDDATPDKADWLVLLDGFGSRVVTGRKKQDTAPPTWPSEDVPMQMHMDFEVPIAKELHVHRARAEQLGALLLHDRSDVSTTPLRAR